MRQATERSPVAQTGTVEKAVDKAPTLPQANAGKPATAKPDWIEHRDWHGEGVVGERHTD